MTDEKKLLFKTWNGMDRPAMWQGVPIMPFIGLLMGALFAFGFGAAVFAWWIGLVFALPFLFVMCAFYYVSALDDRYSRRVAFAIRRIALNLRFGKGLMLTPQNPKWSRYYGKRFAIGRHVSRGIDPDTRVSRP
ncbi:hypothetical protein D9M68_356030 [compost metagenome]